MNINWNDPQSKVSKYFTVKELTFLPRWGVCHQPSEAEKANLKALADKMDQVREILGKPIKVHVCIRPIKANIPGHEKDGENYNSLIGGAPKSLHVTGEAIDFSCPGLDCDAVRSTLLAHLEPLKMCMEDLPGSLWIHLDIRKTLPRSKKRFFKP